MRKIFKAKLLGWITHVGDKWQSLGKYEHVSEHTAARLVLVGKEHCYETTKELPIASVSEAVKAAKQMSADAPFAGKTYYLVESLDQNRCLVTFSVIKAEVFDAIATRAWMVLPESLLIKVAMALPENLDTEQFRLDMSERVLSVMRQGGHFRSQVISASQSEQTSSGYALDYSAFVYSAFGKVPGHLFTQAFNIQRLSTSLAKVNWRLSLLGASMVFICYLAASSLWLNHRSDSIRQQVALQQKELDYVFNLQHQVEVLEKELQAWKNETQATQLKSVLLPLLLDAVEQNIELLSFVVNQEGITVRGRAPKATDAIAFFASRDEISMPESVAPVVNSSGREIFSVRFNALGAAGE
ncbi:hypothetical protein GCM10009092_17750 [Bowmanella denitrificans]|uniref:Uncharacterized protein n=1 Tax=Bowmanella denitrificans TaxID=366582 RepID=A0ABP3GVW8_9ALTE